jgi:hypothetical protein
MRKLRTFDRIGGGNGDTVAQIEGPIPPGGY